jgi:hypothetical protein
LLEMSYWIFLHGNLYLNNLPQGHKQVNYLK